MSYYDLYLLISATANLALAIAQIIAAGRRDP